MLGLGFALTNFGTKGGVVDTPDLSGSSAAALLAAYGGEGFSLIFDSTAPSLKISDSTTPSNDWDSDLGDGYSVQDFFKNRSFTSYTGPVSTGKRLMQSDGYIKPCRHNLLPMSNRFGSGAWTQTAVTSTYGQTDADGGSKASLITESNTSTSALYNATAFTTTANVPYTISVKIKKGNSTWVRLAFGTSGGTFTNGVEQWYNLDTVAKGTAATTGTASHIASTITADSNSYYILTLTASQASTTGAFIVSTATADASATRTTSGTYYIYQAMCNAGAQRLEYVSSEAHNLVLYSQTFDNANWVEYGSLGTIPAASQTAPDGTATAYTITAGAATAIETFYHAVTLTAGLTYTKSFYVKAGTHDYFYIAPLVGAESFVSAVFDLTNTSATTASETDNGTTAGTIVATTQEKVSGGYYRVSVTFTGLGGTVYIMAGFASAATGNAFDNQGLITDTFAGTETLVVWGSGLELSSAPGKYWVTTAASTYVQHFDLPIEFNTNGTVKALTREEQRTNLALYSNDLTNAAWTKSNMSTAMTATGADGASNSATTCTATAANATVLQAITSASSARITSAYIKRRTGSGNIDMTQDNGSTWTTVSVTSSWTRLNIASVTSTNPTVGLRIVTSGDAIDVMYFQHEAAATVSSPIVTGSAAVTRAADVIEFSNRVLGWSDATLSVYTKATLDSIAATQRLVAIDDGTANETHQLSIVASTGVYNSTTVDGGVTQANASTGNAATAGTAFKAATSIKVNDLAAGLNNGTLATDTSITMPTVHTVRLGAGLSAAAPSTGGIHEFLILPTDLSDAQIGSLTTL